MMRWSMVLLFVVSLVAFEASALIRSGSTLVDFKVHDYRDKAYSLSSLHTGRAALIVFEDKDAGKQNKSFKKRFAALQKTLGGKVVLIPVADVSKYDYWPAKGFVKDALQDAGKKVGVKVYADWSGKGRSALGASAKRSNLVLVDKHRKVLWASAGQLTVTQEDRLLDLVKDAAR